MKFPLYEKEGKDKKYRLDPFRAVNFPTNETGEGSVSSQTISRLLWPFPGRCAVKPFCLQISDTKKGCSKPKSVFEHPFQAIFCPAAGNQSRSTNTPLLWP